MGMQSLLDAAEAGPRLSGEAYMNDKFACGIIYSLCIVSLAYAALQAMLVIRMNMDPAKVKVASPEGSQDNLIDGEGQKHAADEDIPQTPQEAFKMMKFIADLVSDGSITFLKKEYFYLQIFCVCFDVILYFAAEVNAYPYTTVAFLIGAQTSMLCGYLGMRIATLTNWRTTYACNISIDEGFHVALRGGQVLGFALVGLALLILIILIQSYSALFLPDTYENEEEVLEYHT